MRHRYQPLNVEQAKRALAAGFVITAADGDAFFDSNVMRQLGLHTNVIHSRAFNSLRTKGFIVLNREKSKLPAGDYLIYFRSNQGYYAIWEQAGKEKGK